MKMPRTPDQYKKIRENTRSLILNSALEQFSKKGFHGTTISDIASAAGISKGLAYNYFESKQRILEAIFEDVLDSGRQIEIESFKADDPFEQIRIMIEFSFEILEKNEKHWRLFFGLAMQPEITEQAMKVSKEFNTRLSKKIAKAFKLMGIQKPEVETRIFEAIFDGVALHFYMDKEEYPLQKIKKNLLAKYSRQELGKNYDKKS